jgi:trehalose/maltose hydrolase-like predicted phosphorylase
MGNISRYFAVVLSTIPLVLAAWVTPPSIYNTSFPDVTWDNEAWTLTSRNPNNSDWYSQSFVSNGYIGSSFASTGPFLYTYDVSGGPYFNEHVTFSTVAGFFDRQLTTSFAAYPWLHQYGWESAISGIPAWGSIVLDLGNSIYLDGTIDETELSDITLQQNFQQGFASYSYTWTSAKLAGETLLISYLVFADKSYPNRAHVQMRLASSHAMQVKAVNIIDGSTALRTDPAQNGVDGQFIYTVVQPNGVNNVTAWIYSTLEGPGVNASTLSRITDEPYISNNPSTIAQMVNISLEPQQPVSVTKYVAIATTDAFTDPKAQARNESIAALETGFESAFQQHVEEWAKVFLRTAATSFVDPTTGSLPDYLVERQITSVVAAAILLMNTVSENALAYVNNAPINTFGLGVCGLLSDCYGGQRFWDQDIWMGPYLFATKPSAAKQISLSRVAFYRQSQINIGSAYIGSKYNVSFSPGASNYAWSTGRDGNCTAFTPCWDYEYYINGDIVKGFIDYWSSSRDNALFEESLLPITNSIATFYSDLIELNQTTGMWVLTNMTDPDEYASFVNNGAYTMSLIQYTLLAANYFNSLFNQSQNNNWNSQAYTLEIPIDTQMDLTLEYSGMADSISIKQADVVLLTYPLNNINNATLDNQLENLNFYSSEEDLNGPGMTWAIYSIDSSALESSGCAAYTYDLYAWTPYLRAPWFTFSEQMDENNGGAYPFLTGLGGFL